MKTLTCILVPSLSLCAGCSPDDFARLKADSLAVSPCRDHEAATFAPFRWEADFLRWFDAEGYGEIEMRKGYRATTVSDEVVLQFSDIAAVRQALKESPDQMLSLDGKLLRLSVSLQDRCPEATQALLATNGLLAFKSFDTSSGGEIKGSGTFDLVDMRHAGDEPYQPAAKGVEFEFSMEVRTGPPYEEFTFH